MHIGFPRGQRLAHHEPPSFWTALRLSRYAWSSSVSYFGRLHPLLQAIVDLFLASVIWAGVRSSATMNLNAIFELLRIGLALEQDPVDCDQSRLGVGGSG